ncbi:MAG TPA: flagellar biosynthetic protein FliR [Anaeromyxobacteraceae bacterium]|nr:flagellar biosynthetic protein FliR [Anaeromyxobacteraceae bacterium]
MTAALADVPPDALRALSAAALDVGACSLRLVPVVALSPFLGGPVLPPAARAGLALALGAAVRASLPSGLPPGTALLPLVASELALGTVLAFAASLPVEAARGAGRLVDTLRGATLGELHVAPIRQRETALGDLLAWWAIALGAWAGADRLLVAALLDTFRVVPPGGALPLAARPDLAASVAAGLLSSAVCLGAPAAAAILAAEMALAVAARLAPRSSLADAAAPLRGAVGVAAIALPAAAIGGRLVEMTALAAGLAGAATGSAP